MLQVEWVTLRVRAKTGPRGISVKLGRCYSTGNQNQSMYVWLFAFCRAPFENLTRALNIARQSLTCIDATNLKGFLKNYTFYTVCNI